MATRDDATRAALQRARRLHADLGEAIAAVEAATNRADPEAAKDVAPGTYPRVVEDDGA